MNFKEQMQDYADLVNKALENYVPEKETPEGSIYKAMRYSLTAGGKRLRPILALSVCDMLEGNTSDIIPAACALEMIHTYSLIHDDLPAMDNDDYRRGRLTSHKVFGEALAILAGDALLNRAFEVLLQDVSATPDSSAIKIKSKAAHIISLAAGTCGMIGGQVVDLESEGKAIPGELLEYMHKCKTGALIKAPVLAAAAVCNADEAVFTDLEKFSELLGLAFQIKDDILDVEGNPQIMGKAAGSDAANLKTTFVTVYGLEGAKQKLDDTTEKALKYLERFGKRGRFLCELTEYLAKRNK